MHYPFLIRSSSCNASWISSAALAWQHGVYLVARPLRMDYMQLKKRPGGIPSHPRKAHRPAFVELVTSRSAVPEHCVIEFESSTGGKMRIQWKGRVRA